MGYGHDPDNSTYLWFDKMSGTMAPSTATSPGHELWLRLKSDPYVNDKGFEILMEERHHEENCKFDDRISGFIA